MNSLKDKLKEQGKAKLRALWKKDPVKVKRLAELELKKRRAERAARLSQGSSNVAEGLPH